MARPASELAFASHFDLLLLDVMLPKIDGWTVVERLRGQGVLTPILFLTADADSVPDRVKGLELRAETITWSSRLLFGSTMARVRSSSPARSRPAGRSIAD